MGIGLEQYRVCIGIFNAAWCVNSGRSFEPSSQFSNLISLFIFVLLCLLLSGDIEINPGPGKRETNLSVCHWNLNSVWVDDFSKIDQISAFLEVHEFDIFCIGESFLNSEINDDDQRLAIENYSLIRSDHPSGSKRGGVCIYFRDHLGLEERPELTTLDECLVVEIKTSSGKFFLCVCYRSPSQTSDEFEDFINKWEETIINVNNCSPNSVIFLGDFNVKNSDWWSGDTTDAGGREIQNLATQHGLNQLIGEPTHILPNASSSCIDLIFSSADHLSLDSGVLPSLYPRCHHQIVFCKINFKIPFPPSYKRRIWDFSRANSMAIQRAIDMIDWDIFFEGRDINGQVSLLTETLLNIFSNFVPNKIITVKNKDSVWMTAGVKQLLLQKAKIYERYVKNGRTEEDFETLSAAQSRCKKAIKDAKKSYYTRLANSLNDPSLASKKYWSILNQFLHKKKAPRIPPVRNATNNLVAGTSEKANIFNLFFANQCSLIETNSVLPPENIKTNLRLNNIYLDETKVLALIRSLDSNKAHGWDEISIQMVKMCDRSLVKPLMKIFQSSLDSCIFPEMWKKANVIPVYKNKGDKSVVKNYRPVSLLPIFGKLFEKCLFDTIYSYFEDNNLFSSCQSGFRKGDSCISQLLSITHDIFKGFDSTPLLDTRGIFLDISKAFDRVWHEGLVFKLKSYGISGSLLLLLQSFLSERFQRVALDGQSSEWTGISAGVPQGSILGPFFFLIYINDLPDEIISKIKIFADDSSIFSLIVDQLRCSIELNSDMLKISEWAHQWKMSFNPDPSKQAVEVYFSRKLNLPDPPQIFFNNTAIAVQDHQKHLGLFLDKKLSFDYHLSGKISKANQGIGLINRLREFLPRDSLLTIFKAHVRPHLDYGDIVYDCPGNANFAEKLEKIQYNACLAITGCFRGTSRAKLYRELGLESLADRRFIRRLVFFYKIVNGLAPSYLSDILPPQREGGEEEEEERRRERPPFRMPFCRTERYRSSFFPYCIAEWNRLDRNFRELPSSETFKDALLKLYRPKGNPVFYISDNKGVILLTRLRIGFSHLREHKFRHNFADTLDPFCNCRTNSIETTEHFLMHCSEYSNERLQMFNDLLQLDLSLIPLNPSRLLNVLLYGDSRLTSAQNREILSITVKFLCNTERFSGPLF